MKVSNSGGSRTSTNLARLNPILMDGLLRVNSRLSLATVNERTKFPVILPARHHVTDLIVSFHHIQEGHAGGAHVLATIRKRWWITNGASTIKRVLRRCMICRRMNARNGLQQMAPLPTFRIEPGWHPFSHIGVDYFGPLLVRHGRSNEKRDGCIFTCLKSRGVHIEVVYSLTTDSFIMSLLRFMARRGTPQEIHSDNGSIFVGAERELKLWVEGLDQNMISRKLSLRNVQWHFNPPYASHRGGVWERLIRSARRILTALGREQTMTDEVLSTTLSEAERILNNRPIVPVTSEDYDLIALTPNDLILLRSNDGTEFKPCLRERYKSRWKQANHLASVFWKRWTAEYRSSLLLRQKWISERRNFRNGDVVLVANENTKRNLWPLGVIVGEHAEEDGLVRTVLVRSRDGVVARDIRQLCLVEGADED